MKVAIVGAGISGLVCAARLCGRHEVQVFEESDWIGGHTHTVDVEVEGKTFAVDTGFIVFNDRNYPNFSALLSQLGIASNPTRMTFGFASDATGLEYSGSSLSGLFAQRRNVFRPTHWQMLAEALRFFRCARALILTADISPTLGEFLDQHQFSSTFQNQHILPMGAAIWSSPPSQIRDFPALSFARFFQNHGLLSLRDRPQWRVIRGGSARYVEALSQPFKEEIRLKTPIRAIKRDEESVEVTPCEGAPIRFDAVVLATHSDQALALLSDATPIEKDILGSIRYQKNQVTLHTDETVLPANPRALAAWNYRIRTSAGERTTLTYDMNALQGLDSDTRFLVTLNSDDFIDPSKIIEKYEYAHPVFDADAIAAQQRGISLGEEHRTAYCGAYWGNGFHEDGVNSGILAAEQIERLAR